MRVLGIDPGMNGALAFLTLSESGQPIGVETHDMPVFRVKRGHELDEAGLARLIDAEAALIDFAILERQQARPGDQGPGAFKLGVNFGSLRMVLAASFVPYKLVQPQVWKRSLGLLGEGKDGSRRRASAIFPRWADQWPRVKDDGRAEAALIALYGANQLPVLGARKSA